MFRCNFTKYLPWSVIPKVLNLSVLWMSTLLCWICVSSLNVNSLQKYERVFHYFFNNTNIGSSPGSYNSHTCWVQEFSHLGCETNTFKRLIGEPWFVYKGNWKKTSEVHSTWIIQVTSTIFTITLLFPSLSFYHLQIIIKLSICFELL